MPTVSHSVKIIDIAEADRESLAALFDRQCGEWLERLAWDYSGPARQLLQVILDHELTGVVAQHEDQVIGFTFYVIDGTRCSIGDIYLSPDWRDLAVDGELATSIFEAIDRLPKITRIESQSVSFDNHEADRIFRGRGFRRFERLFMTLPLGRLAASPVAHDSSEFILRRWDDGDFSKASRIIRQSYHGEHDSQINSQYQTDEGCAELLSILTDSIWCGAFLPAASRVASVRRTGKKVGVLIASRLASSAGHLAQISVLPEYQGLGIGRRMIEASIAELALMGLDTASLAVTSSNEHAVKLYHACGFRPVHSFPVYSWDRP